MLSGSIPRKKITLMATILALSSMMISFAAVLVVVVVVFSFALATSGTPNSLVEASRSCKGHQLDVCRTTHLLFYLSKIKKHEFW